MIIDIILILVIALVAWSVVGEGPWGSALKFLAVLFSGLLAMNFFEPLAAFLESQIPEYGSFADVVSLVGLFALLVFLCQLAVDQISPTSIELEGIVYQLAKWVFPLATGYLTAAILLTALHTAPLPREFFGFTPERKNLFNLAAPDRQWLGFTQHVSEKVLRNGRVFDGQEFTSPGNRQRMVLPSFAIRYATRRDQLARGGAAPPPVVAPTSGGGGVTPSNVGF